MPEVSFATRRPIRRERFLKHRVLFSFHHRLDHWRAVQIREAGVVDGNSPVSDQEWEAITRLGDLAIQRWIDDQLSNASCAVVLIGPATAGRRWIDYEIRKAWEDGKGVLGIYTHNLKDRIGNQSAKGMNPFIGRLAGVVKAYDPPYASSAEVREYIFAHLEQWVSEAIDMRAGVSTVVRERPAGLEQAAAK